MKIFIARSFQEEDKKITEQIKKFIKSEIKGVDFVEKEPKYTRIWPEIEKSINECRAAVGILTKGPKVNGKDEWRTRGWILTETAYCVGKGMSVPTFVEDGVSDLGFIPDKEFVSFSRSKNGQLIIDKKKAKKYLRSVFIPFGGNYSFSSLDWEIQIFKDGHGINEEIIDLYIPPESKFEKVQHMFGLGPLIAKTEKLPSFAEMKKTNYRECFNKHTVFGRIIEDKKRAKRKIELEESPSESSSAKKVFYIRFLPKLIQGEKVKYGWGWSCPKTFFIKKLSPKQKYDDETVISITHPTKRLSIKIFFEKDFPILGSPWIEITDLDGNPIRGEIIDEEKKINEEKKLEFTQKGKVSGINFIRDFSYVRQNTLYRIRWKLKK